MKTLGIINVRESTIAREVDQVIYTRAGPEIGVASTKAFTAQLIVLYKLAFQLGGKKFEGKGIATLIEETLKLEDRIKEIAQKYVAKKHHNVSHLKEFGVIFLNPIAEDIPGKFLRDFALLLHYFHEIEFYSKLFRRYSGGPDFAVRLKALLRGDVKNVMTVREGEWLIVQRYLFKENPDDPRLFLPRVNPESLHWLRGERDIARLGEHEKNLGLEMWWNRDWVAFYDEMCDCIASFDLEDNAMSAVSAAEGKQEIFGYHQREALWTKIFQEYAGGEAEAERLLIENFDKGSIVFNK